MTKQKNQQMGCGVGKQKRRNLFNAIKIYGFQLTIRKKLVYIRICIFVKLKISGNPLNLMYPALLRWPVVVKDHVGRWLKVEFLVAPGRLRTQQ